MPQPFVRNRATWLAYLMLAFFGFLLNIFGPITPFLKNDLKLSYTVSSLHFSAFALGIIAVGLIGHQVIDRLGQRNSLWAGAFGMSLSALLLIAGRDPVVTIGASLLMGLTGSLILAIVPSILADQHGEMRAVALSEANLISSIFSAGAPVLVGAFALTAFGWRASLVVVALCAVIMRIGFGAVTLSSPSPVTEADQPKRLPRIYWVYWVALVLAVSIEFCMVFWSADYLETGLGMAKPDAAQAVSIFLAGMIIGRLLISRLVRRLRIHWVVVGSILIAAVGFLIYWTAVTPLVGIVGLFITGLGVSSLYPLILSLALGSAGGSTVRASAYSSLASGVAIFSLPLVLGRLADAAGIRAAYGVVIVLLMAIFVTIQGIYWRQSQGSQ